MAKIVEDVLVIKFSKIVKDNEGNREVIANRDIQQALEQVAQEVVVDVVVVVVATVLS